MRLWQAVWTTSGDFLIWGESQERYKNLKEDPASDLHPYCCTSEQLVTDLDLLEFDPDETKEITVFLPTSSGVPTPSPKLAHITDFEHQAEEKLQPWKVNALRFDPLSVVALLSSLPHELPLGLRLEDSFRVYVESTKLLLDLLAHGRFLPTLAREEGNYIAHWQLSLNKPDDKERVKSIARALPPIGRLALADEELIASGNDQADLQSPYLLIESFLATCADSLVRMFLKNYELSPDDVEPRQLAAKAWLKNLTEPIDSISSSTHELLKLEEKLKHWSAPMLTSGTQTSFTTAFRVVEPEVPTYDENFDPEQAQWSVEFLLQSTTDNKVFLAVEDFWEGSLGFLGQSDLSTDEIEERLLTNLGTACSIFPDLKGALKDSKPSKVKLFTKEAYVFLKETAPLLEQIEFPVITPSWWHAPEKQLGLHLEVNPAKQDTANTSGLLGMGQLVDFNWTVAIGDKKLTPEDFQTLVKQHSSLINVGGQWVEIQPGSLESTFKFLEKQGKKKQINLFEAMRLGLGMDKEEGALPIVGFRAGGWVDDLLNGELPTAKRMVQPKNFRGELRPYQVDGLSWLAFISEMGIGGCLADDMGLGKTIQFIALLSEERVGKEEQLPPNLLVVPMSIIDNWESEISRFAPELSCYVHHGPGRLSGESFVEKVTKTDVIITTYSLLSRDLELFKIVKWGRLALDEAQNIKNTSTKQSQAVRELTYEQMDAAKADSQVFNRLALTGTPLENHLDELWSIFDFLNPGFLGKLGNFRTRFTLPIERYKDKEATEVLNKVINPFILRRLKTDPTVLSDLPEKLEIEVFTKLTDEQASLYQKVLDELLPQVDGTDGIHRKGLVLSAITKLKQICNHPALFLKDDSELKGRSGKLDRLEQLLEVILAEGDKVLIFSQYAQMGKLLRKHFSESFNQEVLFFHGGQSKQVRKRIIDTFQGPKGPQILILSLKAGGFGLNLTAANQVIHFDQWWNPAVEDQATDRAYRIGQKRNVQVRKFICKGTLEEKIADILKTKKDLADSIVGSPRNMITEMSMDELRDLLTLSANSLREQPTDEQAADAAAALMDDKIPLL